MTPNQLRQRDREAYGAGYEEGANGTLYGCRRKIAKHLDAPVSDDVKLERIRFEVQLWTKELRDRGLL